MALPKKLIALLAVFAAIGLVTATGAFTTVSADRTADVSVAGDSSALLQLQAVNADYAQESGGTLEIALDGSFGPSSGSTGSGVNLDAVTTIDAVFNITNQGTQEVSINITKIGDNPQYVEFHNTTSYNYDISATGNADTLGTGETVTVSMRIDTEGASLSAGNQLLSDITIVAEATS